MAEALSPVDLASLQCEVGPVRMHMGAVMVFDGSVTREELVERLEQRIHLVPRYRMRLERPRLSATPVLVEDERFDPGRHVHRLAVPDPGGDAELCEVVGELMSDPLDRERPLWRLYVLEGLSGGRTAVAGKLHHVLVDGLAAVNLGVLMLDPTPEPLAVEPPPAAPPERRLRSRVEQLGRFASQQLDVPLRAATEAVDRALSLDPAAAARQMTDAARVAAELVRVRPPAPATRLNAEIGPDRLFAVARGRLDEVKRIAAAAGAKVNDVVLGAVALALSDFLGEDAPDRAVALVPMSVRRPGEDGAGGNRFSTGFVDLPLAGEPLERLRSVSAAMAAVKHSPQVRAGALLVGASGLAPPTVSAVVGRALRGRLACNLVVSNVPGPQQTFYLAGTPLREVFPAVPNNPSNQGLTVGVVSYDGAMCFGLLADRDSVPDVADAAAALERALRALSEAAG